MSGSAVAMTTGTRPQLFGTPLSHFTRKIRILFAELGVDFDFVRLGSVLAPTAQSYADNPLLRIPTLVHGDTTLIESDHIARYVVGEHDPSDRLGVRSEKVDDMNRLAVANGIMSNGVTLILGKRGGLEDVESVAYLRKVASAIESGLAWLDARAEPDAASFDYRDIALVCMWQHLLHYGMVRDVEKYARIDARVARLSTRPSIASTTPVASLAEAEKAGWKPT